MYHGVSVETVEFPRALGCSLGVLYICTVHPYLDLVLLEPEMFDSGSVSTGA